ncbi:MAG TPA: hypothetical protein VGJ19_04655 [Streptosporangiaceae bacterium]
MRQACHWRSEQQVLAAANAGPLANQGDKHLEDHTGHAIRPQEQTIYIEGSDNGPSALTGLFTGV